VGRRVFYPLGHVAATHRRSNIDWRLDIAEAAVTPPTRTCYDHQWQDVTAAQVVSFLTHEAVHRRFDLRRHIASQEVSHAC
jgi:hypothetical protein